MRNKPDSYRTARLTTHMSSKESTVNRLISLLFVLCASCAAESTEDVASDTQPDEAEFLDAIVNPHKTTCDLGPCIPGGWGDFLCAHTHCTGPAMCSALRGCLLEDGTIDPHCGNSGICIPLTGTP
jgi:hypothetical protein